MIATERHFEGDTLCSSGRLMVAIPAIQGLR